MNFVLTIDNQPLVLKLEAILALFGKSRTMEFAEGKWTPFVMFQVEDEPNSVAIVQRVDFTDMNKSEIESTLKGLPRDVYDFPGFVRDAIEKIEEVRQSMTSMTGSFWPRKAELAGQPAWHDPILTPQAQPKPFAAQPSPSGASASPG